MCMGRLVNFKGISYKDLQDLNAVNLGYINFGSGKRAAKKSKKRSRVQRRSFPIQPTVCRSFDCLPADCSFHQMERACDVVINFFRKNKNPNKSDGGMKVNGIRTFTDSNKNVIGGIHNYKNVMRIGKQSTKTAIWAVYNPDTNQQGTQVVSYSQFVKDLKNFKISGAASFEVLGKYAHACAQQVAKQDLHPEPLVVHLLEQAEEVEFLGHTDSNTRETDSRVRVSVILKLQEGLCHAVGFWPCGCGADDRCEFCGGDTKDDQGRLQVKCPQHFVVPYRYGKCALVFDSRQRHMTKVVNPTTATHCFKLGFFFATKVSMSQAQSE